MSKKRRTKINPVQLETKIEPEPKKENIEVDFFKCVRKFSDELEIQNKSIHTIDWYKRNLKALYRFLTHLKLSTDPNKIAEQELKEVIAYLKRDKKESPTTINHRIKSMRHFFKIINQLNIVDNLPTRNIEKLKTTKY
ncbi:MAG: phage integrase N-terminal SAM-like domain-containing protein [Clostridiales bacterium]|nr:phage integrase N-terminal SAM-like domain-containing protein [Clostridiales bacterium]MCF8023068.1 phage integrase N-terminal SAM-like domain-containing protein [Clostridiales bacterium]